MRFFHRFVSSVESLGPDYHSSSDFLPRRDGGRCPGTPVLPVTSYLTIICVAEHDGRKSLGASTSWVRLPGQDLGTLVAGKKRYPRPARTRLLVI